MSQHIEYIGGPWDGLKTEWYKIPPPIIDRPFRHVAYQYQLHDVDGDLVYYMIGFHGDPICPAPIEPVVEDEA